MTNKKLREKATKSIMQAFSDSYDLAEADRSFEIINLGLHIAHDLIKEQPLSPLVCDHFMNLLKLQVKQ